MDWIKRILNRERRERKKPLEVKMVGKRYYLYESTTIWLREEKRRKKVSRYIGKITPEGIIEGAKRKRDVRSIYEYGNARLIMEISKEILLPLKEAFPEDYKEIIAMGLIRVLSPTPMRLMKSRWEKLYLVNEMEVSLSANVLSEKLRFIGANWKAQKDFFDYLLNRSKYLLFDLSSIVSYSENLRLAEKGYNASHLYLKQVNFLLIFGCERRLPVAIKALPGSVRDVKSLKSIIKEMDLSNHVVVLDRGFASYYLPDLLKEGEIKYVLPLRRNFKIIDYEQNLRGSFSYRKRGINWGRKRVGKYFVYLFEDVKLRAEEETAFIEMIEEGKRRKEEMLKERKKFGRIAILSNISTEGQEIYLLYKEREEVEVAFDAMKNELENDKIYLSNDDAVRGYFFVSFISLYFYFRILETLRERELIGKMSVNEILFELSKVYLVCYNDGEKGLSEIPKKAEEISKMFGVKLIP